MNTTRTTALALLLLGSVIAPAQAQQPGLQRTDLIQQDIEAPGRQVVQVRVDFAPGAVSIKHNHPGEEVAYVLEGVLEYRLEGREPVTLTAGQSLFIPSGVAHVAANVGSVKASELATYVVRKGETLLAPVK
ncbi:MAG TPA: cupin domain-containing protein [Ensifer sp.]|jgi:quercetin dioxygenase-like cupin family protein|uniref:cupin domain-containing protein n=1 Tax=Ensifer sp. TaxID=1872086 RepID=UPI002E0FF373|nr:cupin domain-containing protein [Ensifer sp.]